MKKTYLQPEMEVYSLGVEKLICVSLNEDTPANPGQPVGSKERLPIPAEFEGGAAEEEW